MIIDQTQEQEDVMSDQEQAFKADKATARRLAKWVRHIKGDEVAQAEALPLRRDMVALLTYVRDNRVTGTQSTGNQLPRTVWETVSMG